MIFRVPSYYTNFRCIADKCKDNCCIGWEIDIDDVTAETYRSTQGTFGERLRSNIQFGTPSCFILGKQERCPFLNAQNLCDIITELGETALCQICTDHPRFYEWFGGIKEGGIGMCCEEAARIILSQDAPFSFAETEIPDESCEECDAALLGCLQAARERIFTILHDECRPLSERFSAVLDFSAHMQDRIDNGILGIPETSPCIPSEEADPEGILCFLQTLEPISPQWHPTLKHACEHLAEISEKWSEFSEKNPQIQNYLRNTAVYFIWRYFLKGTFDGEFFSRTVLAVGSAYVIGVLLADKWLCSGILSTEDCAETAKNYSKEIEYSEENLNAILDAAYMLSAMSAGHMKGLPIFSAALQQ